MSAIRFGVEKVRVSIKVASYLLSLLIGLESKAIGRTARQRK